jgi:hypothetical protein
VLFLDAAQVDGLGGVDHGGVLPDLGDPLVHSRLEATLEHHEVGLVEGSGLRDAQ